MQPLRCLMSLYRAWVALLLACTLTVRLAVPLGFMPVAMAGTVSLQPCPAAASTWPMTATHHHGVHEHGKAEGQCPFAAAGLSAVNAVAAMLAIPEPTFPDPQTMRIARQAAIPFDRWRPPLRAPPGQG